MRGPPLKIGIFEYELLAICLGVVMTLAHFPNRPILLRADNLGARGAVVRGTCRTRVGRALSSYMWNMASKNPTLIWIEFAKSGLNVADAPSRFRVENKPVNEFTKGVPMHGPPETFLSDLASGENLLSLGLNPKQISHEDWHCPVHGW